MHILFWWWCCYTHYCTEILAVTKDIWTASTASPLIQSEPEVTQSIQNIGFLFPKKKKYTKYVHCVCVCVCACLCTCMCGCKCDQITVLAISVYCVILRRWFGVDIGKGNIFFTSGTYAYCWTLLCVIVLYGVLEVIQIAVPKLYIPYKSAVCHLVNQICQTARMDV